MGQVQKVNLASCRIQIRQPHIIMQAFFSQIAVYSYFAPAVITESILVCIYVHFSMQHQQNSRD